MPKIAPNTLDLVCYLYADAASARAGQEFGGTGFFVAVGSEQHKTVSHLYAVTNWHVACRGHSVVRVNTNDGGIDIFDFGPEEWEFDPRYDIAVAPLPVRVDFHKVVFIGTQTFLTQQHVTDQSFGPGEDVFMVGRFVDHDGGLVNLPAVRFGNVSVMPTPIEQPNGQRADMFCIDLHSRSGYSGSPVFVYRTPGFDLTDFAKEGQSRNLMLTGVNYLGLLGIHCSQFPEMWEVQEGQPKVQKEGHEPLITEGKYIKGLSGMTCVLPAWTILEVLNMPKLRKQRAQIDAEWTERFKREGQPSEAEVAFPPTSDADPKH